MKNTLWSVFEFNRFNGEKNIWKKGLSLYMGNFKDMEIDLETDWRFKEVTNKRSLAVFLGLYDGDFPILEHIENNPNFYPEI